jgi:hypothetical protein
MDGWNGMEWTGAWTNRWKSTKDLNINDKISLANQVVKVIKELRNLRLKTSAL